MKKRLLKWTLGLFLVGLLLLPLVRQNVSEAQPAVWLTDYNEALKIAKDSGKPILIDFQAEWCGPCHMLRDQVFDAPIFKPQAKRWVLLAVDVDKQPKLAVKYAASSLPSVLILNSQGKPVLGTRGYSDPQSTIEFLDDAYKRAVQ